MRTSNIITDETISTKEVQNNAWIPGFEWICNTHKSGRSKAI